ncbi:integrase arm-type DNA-binding domain-containing protein [uncultured Sphingomonas sp.]|uniref:tyrosine-type recombinase/integrase n=1 Tax=uncultured Sphingomonas sp. TaxID=158754 RepID=UPI0025DF1C6F|nr:integrase arm-type DNA-binding domain-containing protein [uncultured Sphingomonas sp.]
MLTNAQVRTARPKPRAYRLPDGQGLHLYVAPTGLKSWRVRFRLAGREQLLTVGQFPDVDLSAAREAAAAARDALRAGRDPREERAARAEVDRTFEAVARAWHAHWRSSWTEIHAGDVITSLERDVFPAIGTIDVDDVGVADIRDVLRAVEARGAIETSKRLRQRISKVFGFAIANEWASFDPAASVKQALAAAPIAGEQLALVSIDDARELLAASTGVPAPAIVQLASRFLALTGVRLGALRGMQWDELHDVDWSGEVAGPPAPVWVVPAGRMKLAKAKKGDRRFDHVVPLSRQAVEILRVVRALAIDPVLVFSRGNAAPIAESAIGALYRKSGFAGRHVPHGWRATFSTILNERYPGERVTIDRALGHAAKKGAEVNVKVEGAYNRSKQLGPRRRVMQIWADLLMPPA